MDSLEIARSCRCGACAGPVGPVVNLVVLRRRVQWKYPVAGNVLTGEEGQACAVVCDACIEAKRPILEAVEFTAAGGVYHPVEELEEC